MVPCSYLRVFEPLDAFPAAERERWSSYVANGRGLTARSALAAEARTSAVRLVTGRAPPITDAALVRRVGERLFICPLQLAERHAIALVAFRDLVPDPVVDAFVNADEAHRALDAIDQLARPPHIQESGWEVPLRWFVAFEPGERHFVDPPEGSGPRLLYVSTCAASLARLERAIDVVEATIEDGHAIADALADLAAWVDSFHEDALLELDYGALAGRFADGDLARDRSCELLWEAIDGLERGDVERAVHAYEEVSGHWQPLHHYRAN